MKEFPEYLVALLEYIDYDLTRIMENRYQRGYDSPFQNSGNVEGYKNDTFEAHAYDWGWELEDDKFRKEPVNFKYKDIEIYWYKYLGRGMYINKDITPAEAVEMFNDCMASLRKEEQKDDKWA